MDIGQFDNEKSRQAQWSKIISLSQRMLTLATEYDWNTIVPLERQRRRLLTDYFDSFNPEEQSAELADDIQKLIDINERLLDIAKQSRQGLRDKLQKINKGKQASWAYKDFQNYK